MHETHKLIWRLHDQRRMNERRAKKGNQLTFVAPSKDIQVTIQNEIRFHSIHRARGSQFSCCTNIWPGSGNWVPDQKS